jgi:hypothetical protein
VGAKGLTPHSVCSSQKLGFEGGGGVPPTWAIRYPLTLPILLQPAAISAMATMAVTDLMEFILFLLFPRVLIAQRPHHDGSAESASIKPK